MRRRVNWGLVGVLAAVAVFWFLLLWLIPAVTLRRKVTQHTHIHGRIKSLGGEEEHTETLVKLADSLLTKVMPEHRRALALGLCQLESGFRNIFGHDPTIFVGAGPVTRGKYLDYKGRRGHAHMQGVGWTQLTWWEFQDRADRLGGCWIVENQLKVGLGDLNTMIKNYGVRDGLGAYNAGASARHGRIGQHYATLVLIYYNEWLRTTNR